MIMETEENKLNNENPNGGAIDTLGNGEMMAENEVTEVQAKWKGMLYQILFLLGGILFFVIINYIFGFMKGN